MIHKTLMGLDGDIWHEYYKERNIQADAVRPACHAKKKTWPGNTKAIIIVHGIIDSPFSQTDLATIFNQLGYDVYLPLLTGHGMGTISDMSKVTHQDWLSDITQAIALLNYEKLSIAGFSLGGLLAFYLGQTDSRINGDSFLFSTPFTFRQQKMGVIGAIQRFYINFFNKFPFEYFKQNPLVDKMNPYIYSRIDIFALRELLKLQTCCLKLINQGELKKNVYSYHSDSDKRASANTLRAISSKHEKFNSFIFSAVKKIGHGALVFKQTTYRLDGRDEQHIIEHANPYFDELVRQIVKDEKSSTIC